MVAFFRTILYIPFYNIMIFFAALTGGSVGWAVILLTILVRLILLPSSLKAAKAQVKLQSVQPRINELKIKYKGDQKKQNEEMMKIYKEEGASPFGSCLPLLIQLPIIIILYQVIKIGFDTSHFNMLYSFTPHPEVLQKMFFGIDLSQPERWILPIISGLAQLGLSLLTMPKADPAKAKSNDPAQMMTKQMTYLLPLMTVFIARSLPAAISLYILITTVVSLLQQWYVNNQIRNQKALVPAETGELDEIAGSPTVEINQPEVVEEKKDNKKRDMMARVMEKRLDKADRKKGVEITIRKKGE